MLEIKNLSVEVDGKEIIHNLSLQFLPGKVYALMGPNGSGKTTLAFALSGHPRYKITGGSINLDGKEITLSKPQERSRLGLFLSFQSPAEISGVSISNFLRNIVNIRREKPYSVLEFHALLKETMARLKIDSSFGKRQVNKGFSGGEKKRAEILQMMMIQPKYALLDETDSGLDIDAIKIVAEGINEARKNKNMAVIIITHYHRFLEFIKPDEVHIIHEGKIIATGKYDLAQTIEKNGFEEVIAHAQ